MPDLPTGTVTFLFTDIEGSTRLWEEHPDAMKGALARHDEVLRGAVEASGGHVVKTTGDGVHAVFGTAGDAVAAAVAGQAALADLDGPEGPMRVRMGIHTGEAEHSWEASRQRERGVGAWATNATTTGPRSTAPVAGSPDAG